MSDIPYEIVWKGTGRPFYGTQGTTTDREALLAWLTSTLEETAGLRGMLEVVPINQPTYAAYANHCAIQRKLPMTAASWERNGKPYAPPAEAVAFGKPPEGEKDV